MNIDTNVLFLFNIPNGGKGIVSESPIEALDIYPTLAELYDHKFDPLERKNVVENISYNDDVKFLAHKLPERIQETDHDQELKK